MPKEVEPPAKRQRTSIGASGFSEVEHSATSKVPTIGCPEVILDNFVAESQAALDRTTETE
jgi:hypothetical protein